MEESKLLFLDTNVLYPVIKTPNGRLAHIFLNNLLPNYTLVTSNYVLEELKDILRYKLRHKDFRKSWKRFKKTILPEITVISTPSQFFQEEELLDDPKDAEILRAALFIEADLLTGDHDFLRIKDKIKQINIVNLHDLIDKQD